MNFQCDGLERALSSPELMPDARVHAAQCPHCREQLRLWDEISLMAPSLREEWDSESLWLRIRTSLTGPARRRMAIPVWTYAMAAAAAVAAIAIAVWYPRQPSIFLTEAALNGVQQTNSACTRSIGKLSAIAAPRIQQSVTPLAAAYREKLALLDSAIADLDATLQNNRYNAYLQTQLSSLYRQKQKTLEEWLKDAKRI